MKKNNGSYLDWNTLSEAQKDLVQILNKSCKRIAPLWPLDRFVAVNPYLGFTQEKFDSVAHELSFSGNIQMTLPHSFYVEKIEEGVISMEDLAEALERKDWGQQPKDFIQKITSRKEKIIPSAPTVNKLCASLADKDWRRFFINRITLWASSYFDQGQALWAASNQHMGAYQGWKTEALIDKTCELSGLKNFRKSVKKLPDHPLDTIEYVLKELDLTENAYPIYIHSLLLTVGGWSSYVARIDWDNELYGRPGGLLLEFLAILLSWELCLKESLNDELLNQAWGKATDFYHELKAEDYINPQVNESLVLQEAFDVSAQRQLIEQFAAHKISPSENKRPLAQAIFCIDVRSEVFRRNLEMANPSIETLGFAGFFAFPIKYKALAHQHAMDQCPVLLPAGPTVMERMPKDNDRITNQRVLNRQIHQIWKYFKSSAVSCFSFVSPMGLTYLPKLISDSFNFSRPVPSPDKVGFNSNDWGNRRISLLEENDKGEAVGIALADQIKLAKGALKGMSLKENFAQFVMITGHGSTMVNNPHQTGYDCGACGGKSGESNAKVAAAILNNPEVREALKAEGTEIPADTVFLACLHDTTTDEISIYNAYDIPESLHEAFEELKQSITEASNTTRLERALRLPTTKKDVGQSIIDRSKDWAQIRPEWGLAGCSTFVIGPRAYTKGLNLDGKSFLHSYDYKKDADFSTLEGIMTAPMVVTSWINLQYYGSTVDNKHFGAGNKTLHNVTSGIGVLEGQAGDLRVGLPFQAIHDGEKYQHEPLRLKVVIEAPIEAINGIFKKHPQVQNLCDNGWIKLLAMQEGKITHSYESDLSWKDILQKVA